MTVLAHGLGGSTDLPIPYTYALIGAAWALTLTFAVVALAWRKPRFDPHRGGHRLPGWLVAVLDSTVSRNVTAALGVAATVWVLVAGSMGPQDQRNPLPGAFYVLLWVGVPVASLLLGQVWRAISPLRTLWRLIGSPGRHRYPQRWGYWPAAAGLLAFVWLELVSPDPASLWAIRMWLIGYGVVVLGGALWFGETWFARADPFEVYSMVASRLSPLRRAPSGAGLVYGNPFDHLRTLPVRPGVVAVLAVLLGSTAYDSFSALPQWRGLIEGLSTQSWVVSVVRTVGLVVFVGVVAASFWLAARATGGVDQATRRTLPGMFAHSLIPIVIGYVLAHYLSYLVERGQQTIFDLVGFDAPVHYVLSGHPTVLATIKVGCVLAGHMAGVIAAHDAALRLLPKRHQLSGQLAMMVTMVAYTFTGLYLLFGG